jgi:transcription elongation factor Elf1
MQKPSDVRYRLFAMTKQTANPTANLFDCPTCHAHYKLVRIECDHGEFDGTIACRSCGAPLQGREGNNILKYFLVSGRRAHGRRQQHL